MSTSTLPRGIPAPRRNVRRRPAASVWGGRLIRWFAAEPGRIRAAVLGVVACAATGALVGVAAGVVVARIADLMLGLVEVP
jgi:hypothetical protein